MPTDLSTFITQINDALSASNGAGLAYLLQLNPTPPHAKELAKSYRKTLDKGALLRRWKGSIQSPWDEISVEYACVCTHLAQKRWKDAFLEQDSLLSNFGRFFSENSGWTLLVLFALIRDLRTLAMQADEWEKINQNVQDQVHMRKAATSISPYLSKCLQDRISSPDMSRRWGVYYVVNQIFKCYFKVHTLNLSRNILKALSNSPEVPPLEKYPRSHQVTFHYYLGMIGFYNQDLAKAENELTLAFYNCHIPSHENHSRILAYLIPIRILKGHLPSTELLQRFPVLRNLYQPFIRAIRAGNLKAYDAALEEHEQTLLRMDLWLVMERAREVCLRGLFRHVWKASSTPTRIHISAFHAALKFASNSADEDITLPEAECMVATMIYKGFMKGYISHEKQTVVLSATNAFPRLSDRTGAFSSM